MNRKVQQSALFWVFNRIALVYLQLPFVQFFGHIVQKCLYRIANNIISFLNPIIPIKKVQKANQNIFKALFVKVTIYISMYIKTE